MFKIGDFSRLANTSVRMLRHYDEIGLLTPETIDSFTGYRFYSAKQLDTINHITAYKNLGFSLGIIKEILANNHDTDFVRQYLLLQEKELEESQNRIRIQRSQLEDIIQNFQKEDEFMLYSVTKKEIPARQVISYRSTIPTYADEGMLWVALMEEVAKQKVVQCKDSFSMAIFHDKEYKETNVEVEVQHAVTGTYTDTDRIKFYDTPAVEVASVTFNGSYDQMTPVTKAIADWIENNDFQIAGPMFNIYHVSPNEDPNPESWVTEACFTIEKN